MKRLSVMLFLVISAFGFAQQSPLVKAEVDTTNIRIGEQFEYKISVGEIQNVIIPKLINLKGLEVVDSIKTDTVKNQLIKKYILTGFDSGAYYIPQQQIFIKNQAYLTDSLLINVATVAVDTTKQNLFPIKAIANEPIVFDDYKNYLFWILGILLVVGTVLYFALRRKREFNSKTAAPLLAPYQEALHKLNLLDKKLLWQSNKIKQYYSELTEIIRHYIERELNIPALERTTEGLIENLSDFNDAEAILTNKETIANLKKLLQEADLVKFAKSKPLAGEIENDRRLAEYIINNLKPSATDENTLKAEKIKPVVIIQKPQYKKPSIIEKIILFVCLLGLISLLIFGISKAYKSASNYTNSLNTVEHVE